MTTTRSQLIPFALNPSPTSKVLVVVLDGVGAQDFDQSLSQALHESQAVLPQTPFSKGNAVGAAYMPNLARLIQSPLSRTLLAHGPAVGLPSDDDMGNSEVGHNALGAGRIFAQGAKLVNAAIATGALFQGEGWKKTVARPELKAGKNTLHLCGLLSDGNVHSHIDHLFAVLAAAKQEGVSKVRIHPLLDGRDVGPSTALTYVDALEAKLREISGTGFDAQVASGGGRTVVTMDRYESDWPIVERGYKAHVLGEGRAFSSLREAVEVFRKEGNTSDQMLPPFVIHKDGKPIGTVEDDDSFIFLNFRGDRSQQISRALTEESFSAFDRKRFPKVHFAGMMQYDGDLKIPAVYLVTPPAIDRTMGELLAEAKVRQFACSETQKYGHVTYFWNGNRSGRFDEQREHYVEIPSDVISFEERPWMKCQEICQTTIDAMKKGDFQVGRINFANGDMVGHTGDFAATVVSLSALDLSLGKLIKSAKETNTILLVTADHGNADEMFEIDKKSKSVVHDPQGLPRPKTSHTLSPVPFVIFNSEALGEGKSVSFRKDLPKAGLANVAATVLELAGWTPPSEYEPSLLDWNSGSVSSRGNSSDQKKTSELISSEKKKALKQIVSPEESYSTALKAVEFAKIIRMLRDPKLGCPWDLEQNVLSLRNFLVEEAYECVEASQNLANSDSPEHRNAFADELGDVLLQVFLNAEITRQAKQFSVDQVFDAISHKMIERHPHVFLEKSAAIDSESVVNQWEKIKAASKVSSESASNAGRDTDKVESLLKKSAGKKSLPTLDYLCGISKQSYKLGFAWKNLSDTFGDLRSEVVELEEELKSPGFSVSKIADEAGDVLYALANVVTFLNQEHKTELSLDLLGRQTAQKFLNRFAEMEMIRSERGQNLTEESARALSLDEWNELWKEAKVRRYS